MLNMIKRTNILVAHIAMFRATAFEPGKSCWKLTADGKAIELKDGKPIWIDANGGETTLDGDVITRLNGEARDLRKAKETAEASLAKFGNADPVVALKAIDDMKKIDSKKLIDAGKVDEVRAEITAQFTQQMTELQTSNKTLQATLDDTRIDNVFANSQFMRENIAVPSDMFQASFRNNFKMKDGKIEAYSKDGNRVMSKKTMGEYADAEEALQILVDMHPQKDVILKAPQHQGSGNNGQGGGRNGARTMKRVDFDQQLPSKQAELAKEMGDGKLTIID